MHNLESNKLFAALLVAGIVASLSGFIAGKIISRHESEAPGTEETAGEESAEAPAAPQMPDPSIGLVAAADVERGKTISKACAACHNFEKGGPNGIGPNLWNVMTRGKAATSGFSYSPEMAAHAGQKWTYAELNKFLWKPKWYVPGTKMNYVGLKKPEDRAALMAWLRTQADSPPVLPSDAEVAAENAELAPPPPAAEMPAEAGESPPAHTGAVGDQTEKPPADKDKDAEKPEESKKAE